jgi:hypothetical protein
VVKEDKKECILMSEHTQIATLGNSRRRFGRITFRWILESCFLGNVMKVSC